MRLELGARSSVPLSVRLADVLATEPLTSLVTTALGATVSTVHAQVAVPGLPMESVVLTVITCGPTLSPETLTGDTHALKPAPSSEHEALSALVGVWSSVRVKATLAEDDGTWEAEPAKSWQAPITPE